MKGDELELCNGVCADKRRASELACELMWDWRGSEFVRLLLPEGVGEGDKTGDWLVLRSKASCRARIWKTDFIVSYFN